MNQRSTIPRRASRTVDVPPQTEVDDVPDSYYDTRLPTSTRRYVDTRGNQVIQRGNQRIVIHQEPPPRKKFPWLSLIGIGMIIALLLVWGFNALGSWWAEHQVDATYGFPRTYQVDAMVYQGDSAEHPSHYIFINLNGTVEVIEFPRGDSAHARIYKGPTLLTDKADLVPVTGEIKEGNGKEEMVVHIGDQEIIYSNNGQKFVPQQ